MKKILAIWRNYLLPICFLALAVAIGHINGRIGELRVGNDDLRDQNTKLRASLRTLVRQVENPSPSFPKASFDSYKLDDGTKVITFKYPAGEEMCVATFEGPFGVHFAEALLDLFGGIPREFKGGESVTGNNYIGKEFWAERTR